jgi:hypothetical protein
MLNAKLSEILATFLGVKTIRRHAIRNLAVTIIVFIILLPTPTILASTAWTKTYQEEAMDIRNPTSIVQTTDGGFATAIYAILRRIDNIGYQGHFTTSYELQIMKTSSTGDVQWKHSYPTIDDPNHQTPTIYPYYEKYIIAQTTDGGYVTASSGGGGFWLFKIDSQGIVLWSKTYLPSEEYSVGSYLNSMIRTNDGGFALAGTTWTNEGNNDFWLVKTDSKGNAQWNQTYNSGAYTDNQGNEIQRDEEAKSVIQTRDGGYALSGSVSLYKPSSGYFVLATWVVKTDNQGKQLWNKGYDLLNTAGYGQAIIQTIDNGYAIAGSENNNFCLLKIDSTNQLQWSKIYADYRTQTPCALVQLNDGGYAITGTGTSFTSTMALLRVDSSGQTIWNKTYNAKENLTVISNDIAYAMILTSDGSYALAGSTLFDSETHQDIYIVKTESLEEPVKTLSIATPSASAPSETDNPELTSQPTSSSTQPSQTQTPSNNKTTNPDSIQTLNSTSTLTQLIAGVAIVAVIISIAIILAKRKIKK